jgi:mRNA interferase MazF
LRRGEVWWADLPQPVGKRPVLLLSRDSAYAVRASVTVAPVTRKERAIPVEVSVGKEDGLKVACVVNLDDIQTISKSRLTEKITRLSAEKMARVRETIGFALDLEP